MSETEEKLDRDGDNVTKIETSDIETKEKETTREPKSVSFNRDVHVKRFGRPRESRSSSSEYQKPIRKEPFTHLSEEELIKEANKVIEQASSITCTADHPPEKFFSLPHRKKLKEPVDRRNSDEGSTDDKKTLERSISDVGQKKRRERTSLSTLFRKAQKNKIDKSLKVETKPSKPVVIVKRSKSDVSDLKSNGKPLKPIRKRSGSETEEFLKSLRNKKSQLSPIIESSPREDYFKKSSPLDVFAKTKKNQEINKVADRVVNPIEKPPRFKSPDKEPKPPIRTKRGKSLETDKITATDKTQNKIESKPLVVDEIDNKKSKELNVSEVKERIKESIRKLENNIYGNKDMIHSSQLPPEKPPLTRGHTVGHIVRILKEDQQTPFKSSLISNGSNTNQPFSYIKPSLSPDPNLFTRNTSPERVPSPVNKMAEKGVVYAQVVRENGEKGTNRLKQTVHKTYSPTRERYNNLSDEDEGLGYEDRYKTASKNNFYKPSERDLNIIETPIKPTYREYKLTSFDYYEPTYENGYSKKDKSYDYVDSALRGRGDGMDRKPLTEENKNDLDFNELSHRRQLLESRLKSRRLEKDTIDVNDPISKYFTEDPIYAAEKRMRATEKYVNETAKYYRHTLERDGYTANKKNDYDADLRKVKHSSESRTFDKIDEHRDRREFSNRHVSPKFDENYFPPEPEYEPPSLEFNTKPVLSPETYTEKKYKLRKQVVTNDVTTKSQKYKTDSSFDSRRDRYASNPEVNRDSEDNYANTRGSNDSLNREKSRGAYKTVTRHDSGDSRDYYLEQKSHRRRNEPDSRLFDSGIENDFRKDFNPNESDEDMKFTSRLLDSERNHSDSNYHSEKIYANGEVITRFENRPEYPRKEYIPREKSADDGSNLDRHGSSDKSPSRYDEKVSSKPPKAKKLTGLEKVKQLFSRDSSKKTKKENEVIKQRTRVLKSPEHLEDPGYRRYRDPEPSDDEKRRDYRSSREDLTLSRRKPVGSKSVQEHKYTQEKYREDYGRRRHDSSERDSDYRSNTEDYKKESYRKTRSNEYVDSPVLADRYRERRRLATPSPTPSPPPLREPTSAGNWFKSLDRLTKKKTKTKIEKDSPNNTEEETPVKHASKQSSPAKNLRFFGDTDSDTNSKTLTRSKHPVLRKTTSNSSTGLDEPDRSILSRKSSSLSNLRQEEDSRRYKKKLQNISEYSNSENEARRLDVKPPIDRRSRSQSNSKTLKDRRSGSRGDLRDRGSSTELRGSIQELRDAHRRRRTPNTNSGESSTEGESSLQSQRSVVYLHATTVGDIPDPGVLARNRSRDDVSSVNSSNLQVRTTQKSFSLFAPWTPKLYNDQQDINYGQKPRKPKREPITKYSSSRNLAEPPSTLQKKKSYSQTTLTRRPQNSRLSSSNSTLYRKPEKRIKDDDSVQSSTIYRNKKTQSNNALNHDSDTERISRSISMPKDKNKKAGWFNLTSKNKKQEINTRVR